MIPQLISNGPRRASTTFRNLARRSLLPIILFAAAKLASPLSAQQLGIVDTVCDVDLATCMDGIQGLRGARGIVVSPDGLHAYVASSLDNALIAFSFGPSSRTLNHLQTLFDTDAGVDGLDSARGVAISPDGAHVYVAALLDASVATFSRDSVTGMLTFVEIDRDGVWGVDGLAGAEGVAVSPDGAHVYGAGETDNAVAVFARETDSGSPSFGRLTYVETQFDGVGGVDGLHGAGALAFDPTGTHLYVASLRGNLGGIEGDDWLAAFARNPTTGALSFVQGLDEMDFDIFTGCTGVGNENSGVAVSPDGQAVFLTNPFFGTVAWFDRNPTTGVLTLADSVCDLNFGTDGIAGAAAVTVTPDGQSLLTASPAFQTLAVLQDLEIFLDGFESGDTSAWSATQP
ncbi:MAG: beta-propeller fold lactonase family protein [Acidobacteria bacterium]|nr:beta-propeller fold lactonase family protein [Acidobacteriota bacterium]